MRSQQVSDEFDPLLFIGRLNELGIPYLLIGSVAAAMHDIPIGSADYDFWVTPASRQSIYDLADSFGLAGSYRPDDVQPQDSFTDGGIAKIDFFFVSEFVNQKKGIRLSFDDVHKRSLLKRDSDGSFAVRVHSLDDLIAMKDMLMELRPDQIRQLEYLLIRKETSD
ncbi:MAG: hypothetical protein OHK006_21120 [Thermodesulfovibrionales bacterium]